MRSLFKLSLASLAAVALFAGMAFAQDKPTLTWSGNTGAAFGMYSYGATDGGNSSSGKAYSEYLTAWEAQLQGLVAAGDQFSAIFKYRIRGFDTGSQVSAAGNTPCTIGGTSSSPTVTCKNGWGTSTGFSGHPSAYADGGNDVYTEIHWKPIPALDIAMGKFRGQDWSNPLAGTYIIRNAIGDGEYWMNWTGVSGIDFDFNAGTVQVGLALSDACVPSCNAATTSTGSKTIENTQSMVPHLTGKVGDIAFRAQLPSATGTANCTAASKPIGDCKTGKDQISQTGSGYQVGVKWTGMPGLGIALDLGSFTEGKNKSQTDDRAQSSTAIRVDFSGFMLGYFMKADNNYLKDPMNQSTMTLRYYIPVGMAQIVPEYRSDSYDAPKNGPSKATDKNGKAAAWTQSEFRLIGNVVF